MGEPLDLLAEAILVELLECLDDACVQRPSTLLQQSPVGHLVGQRVLERVLEIGEQRDLVQELCRLQLRQQRTELLLLLLGDLLEQHKRYVLTDDGGDLEESLGFWRKTVDAGGEHRLNRGLNLDGADRLNELILSSLACQHLRLDQSPDGLLDEERVAALDQERLERAEARILAEERNQQVSRPLRGQRLQAELA